MSAPERAIASQGKPDSSRTFQRRADRRRHSPSRCPRRPPNVLERSWTSRNVQPIRCYINPTTRNRRRTPCSETSNAAAMAARSSPKRSRAAVSSSGAQIGGGFHSEAAVHQVVNRGPGNIPARARGRKWATFREARCATLSYRCASPENTTSRLPAARSCETAPGRSGHRDPSVAA